MNEDEAALVADLREWIAGGWRRGSMPPNLPALLRLADEAIASRKVVEAARWVCDNATIRSHQVDILGGLRDAVKALDAAGTGGEPRDHRERK